MTTTDFFLYFWLVSAVLSGIILPVWGICELRSGQARYSIPGKTIERLEDPREFWILVSFKLLALPLACFMFWLGLDMLNA